ncbi:MAG: polysaccharide biosynthesis C-terminal domain-containing protein [bacterium]|nr:polysaccharide biosynthesis C-terminal domain-containing protein [bacterium]
MNTPPRPSILKSTLLIFSGRTVSRILGIIREILSASFFGAGAGMDCFNLAYTSVTALSQVFTEQFLTPIVPIFFRRQEQDGEDAAIRSTRAIVTRLTVVSLLACCLLFLIAKPLVCLLAPGFGEQKILLTVKMIRWFAIGGLGFILHRFLGGIYTCFFRYFMIAYSPVIMNLVTITMLILLAHSIGIISLAAGISLGFMAYLVCLLWFLPHRNQILRPLWGKGDQGLRSYGSMLYPLFLSVGVEQIQLFVDRSLASRLPEGTLSVQGYAFRLVRMNAEFFVGTFGMVIVPVFSSLAASRKYEDFSRNFSLAFQGALLYISMGACIVIALALPLVKVIYERGAFTADVSIQTASLIIYYTIAYSAQGIYFVVLRGFHAFGNTRTPTLTTIFSVTVMVTLDYMLVKPMGIYGLALATAVGHSMNLFLLYLLFNKYLTPKWTLKNVKVAVISLLIAILMGNMIRLCWNEGKTFGIDSSFLTRLIGIVIISSVAILIYLILLKLLRLDAVEFFISKIKTRNLRESSDTTRDS